MPPVSNPPPDERAAAQALAEKINAALARLPDKTWNYSRLRLVVRNLADICAPYALNCDWIDPRTKAGQKQLETLQRELEWGERHSNDLGFLELASLRINAALHKAAGPTSDYWGGPYPVLRVVKHDDLRAVGSAVGLWYEAEEVAGEEFENR